jgi:hypothetical protein
MLLLVFLLATCSTAFANNVRLKTLNREIDSEFNLMSFTPRDYMGKSQGKMMPVEPPSYAAASAIAPASASTSPTTASGNAIFRKLAAEEGNMVDYVPNFVLHLIYY